MAQRIRFVIHYPRLKFMLVAVLLMGLGSNMMREALEERKSGNNQEILTQKVDATAAADDLPIICMEGNVETTPTEFNGVDMDVVVPGNPSSPFD